MAKLALDSLLKPVTPDQAEASILAVAASLGLPVTAWQKGGVARSIILILATVYAGFSAVVAMAVGGGLLDYAVGGWLTLLVRNVYGVERIEATFATGAHAVQLTNAGGGLYVIAPDDLTFSATVGGEKKLYRNTSGGTLLPGPGSVLLLDVQAVEVGAASSAVPGAIDTIETTLLGVTCTNLIAVLGQDVEADPALRERARESLGALSPNGPKAAYSYVAKSAKRADGSSCGVTRVRIPTPPGDGSLIVYVASKTGAISGTIGDLATDLGRINADIQAKVVPEGVGPVTVVSAVEHPISPLADVYYLSSSGLTDSDVQSLANDALKEYFPKVPIGGYVIPPGTGEVPSSALVTAIEASSAHIIKAVVAGGDVALLGHEVAVHALPNIQPHAITG